ncbi:MAG: glycoside hydrolase family 26 protein, partial [Thermoanaerobaculia bacterium]
HISMPWFEYYYPGSEFVDWIGIGVLNYGTVASWSRWWSFHQILEKAYPTLLKLDKPIMVCEFGTLAAGGSEYEWYRQALYHIDHTYARGIKGVILFNQENDITMSTNPLNWSVLQDDRASALVSQSLAAHSAL